MRNRSKNINHISNLAVFAIAFGLFINSIVAQTTQNWQIIVPAQLQEEEAIKVVISDLRSYGKEIGIIFQVYDDKSSIKSSAIIVGNAATNKITHQLLRKESIAMKGVDHPQGYEIISTKSKKGI